MLVLLSPQPLGHGLNPLFKGVPGTEGQLCVHSSPEGEAPPRRPGAVGGPDCLPLRPAPGLRDTEPRPRSAGTTQEPRECVLPAGCAGGRGHVSCGESQCGEKTARYRQEELTSQTI